MMNKVLFETKGTLGEPEWVIKRREKAEALRLKKLREAEYAANATQE